MIFQRLSAITACAAFVLGLSSCGSTGSIDVENPTVSQMDQMDVQWGLSPRRSRGAPKRSFQYRDERSSYSAPSASSEAPARETVEGAPPAASAPEPQLDPARINSLR